MKKAILILTTLIMILSSCKPNKPVVTEPTIISKEGKQVINYLILGDAWMWDWNKFYAQYIQEDLGISVITHNLSDSDKLSSTMLLKSLKKEAKIREQVSTADIITFNADPGFSNGFCMNKSTEKEGNNCFDETIENWRKNFRSIIHEIKLLAGSKGVVLQTMTFQHSPYFSDMWKKNDRFDECIQCWRDLNQALLEVAREEEIQTANVYQVFNGLDGLQNPEDNGYDTKGDFDLLSNESGYVVIAGLFRSLGYIVFLPQ